VIDKFRKKIKQKTNKKINKDRKKRGKIITKTMVILSKLVSENNDEIRNILTRLIRVIILKSKYTGC
jgi:hypothetical protein